MRNRLSLIASVLAVAVAGVASSAPARAETSIEISLKNRYLKLLDDGEVIGKYPVAIGAPESPTVPGQFAVTKMDAAPVYHKKGKVIAPGPQNPVGVRYVAYVQIGTGEYAIHGTAWPNWVRLRSAVSLGCIRMLNDDVIQVFNRIKVGTLSWSVRTDPTFVLPFLLLPVPDHGPLAFDSGAMAVHTSLAWANPSRKPRE